MATDILYVEEGYIEDPHYFAGTYAGASNLQIDATTNILTNIKRGAAALVASAGSVSASGIITTQVPGSASITANATVTGVATLHIGEEGQASITATATVACVATIGLGIEGQASISAAASASGTPSRKRTGASSLTAAVTTVTVGARLLTETALVVSGGTLSVTGAVKRGTSATILAAAAETGIASIQRRGLFAIGTSSSIPADIQLSYDQTGTAVPNVIFSSTSALNKLYLDDYKYTVPSEDREYIIKAETREYTVKE
jgi:hypothetical protein